jgi:hypothetical protein
VKELIRLNLLIFSVGSPALRPPEPRRRNNSVMARGRRRQRVAFFRRFIISWQKKRRTRNIRDDRLAPSMAHRYLGHHQGSAMMPPPTPGRCRWHQGPRLIQSRRHHRHVVQGRSSCGITADTWDTRAHGRRNQGSRLPTAIVDDESRWRPTYYIGNLPHRRSRSTRQGGSPAARHWARLNLMPLHLWRQRWWDRGIRVLARTWQLSTYCPSCRIGARRLAREIGCRFHGHQSMQSPNSYYWQ